MRLQLLSKCWGPSTSYFIYDFVFQVISKKTLCTKDFISYLGRIKFPSNFYYSFTIIPSTIIPSNYKLRLSFRKNHKQQSNFHGVGGLVSRNVSIFGSSWFALYFKDMLSLTDFYVGIFSHVILIRAIVLCESLLLHWSIGFRKVFWYLFTAAKLL